MPSVISHYLLAQRLLSYLKEEHPDFKPDQNALLWGAQGPDFLYAHPDGEIRALADLLHRAPANRTVAYLCDFARGSKNKTDQSYALGFMAHFALDSIAHPFVLYGAQRLSELQNQIEENTAHSLIEVNLDVILLRYEKSDLPSSVRLIKCAPKDETATQHIAVLYPLMLRALFQKNVTLDQVGLSAKSYQKWLRRHTDRAGLKKDFILRREKKRHLPPCASVMYRSLTEDDTYDYANIAQNEWSAGGAIKTDSFFDLFEQADTLLKAMAGLFLTGGDPSKLTNGNAMI